MSGYIYKAIFIVMLLLCVVSCTKTIYVPQVSREVVIDTLVKVAPDSAVVRALLECDSAGKVLMRELSLQKGEYASAEIEVKDNTLTSQTRWRTQVVERVVEHRDTTTVVEVKEVVKEVKHVPAIYKWALGIAIATIGAAIIKGVLWLRG